LSKETIHVWTLWHPGPSKQTYEQHFEIFDPQKKVYWGVINKKDEKHLKHRKYFEPFVERLRFQIKNRNRTYLFITSMDPSQLFLWSEICEILAHTEFPDWEKSKFVPSYYKKPSIITQGREMTYWFFLKNFREITDQYIFQKITRIKDPNDYDIKIQYSREIFGRGLSVSLSVLILR